MSSSREISMVVVGVLLASALAFQLTPAARGPSTSRYAIAMEAMDGSMVIDKPLIPLGNHLMIQLVQTQDKATSGLFLPDTAVERPNEGTVVAAGPGRVHRTTGKDIANPFAPGDLVLLGKVPGESLEVDEVKHILCDAADLLGKFSASEALVANFEPISDHILVKMEETAAETSSGIALALDSNPNENQGEVVAVGVGKTNSEGDVLPMPVSVGDQVLFAEGAGSETSIEGKTFKVISTTDCLAKW